MLNSAFDKSLVICNNYGLIYLKTYSRPMSIIWIEIRQIKKSMYNNVIIKLGYETGY